MIGLVICRVTQQSYLRRHLPRILPPDTTEAIVASIAAISDLAPETAADVRRVYGKASNLQWRILAYIAAANLLIVIFSWRRHPKVIREDHSREVGDPEAAVPVVDDGATRTADGLALSSLESSHDRK